MKHNPSQISLDSLSIATPPINKKLLSKPAPPSPHSALLKAEQLAKSYGGKAVVNGLSLHVGKGEVVGLLGPNGAGKTTAFDIIIGLIKPDPKR